ncbi:hypothetical protein MOJ79_06665 [Calidifontimicrobium sp. SYSU G02091]|uniref:hypothetical protein n=1 Tax=Azohydromonas TaxID=312063 RepID=UPI0013C2C9ED|nr:MULTISPECIES: hypothetical protein [Azohydromonas]MCI1191518.1 hypothetical protein [Calidifontimicrobium sp. SYSU G02091]
MDKPQRRPANPAPSAAEALQAWQELKQRLQQLHAELEYLRLLIKLGVGPR